MAGRDNTYPFTMPSPPTGFSLSPAPTTGQGIYGGVPGQMGLPTSLFDQIGSSYKPFSYQLNKAGNIINHELAGQVPNDVSAMLKDSAAAWGYSMGTPGGQFEGDRFLRGLGLTSLDLQQTGLKNLGALTGMLGPTMLDPSLTSSIAERNALMASAPDPSMAGQHLESLAAGPPRTFFGGGGSMQLPHSSSRFSSGSGQGSSPWGEAPMVPGQSPMLPSGPMAAPGLPGSSNAWLQQLLDSLAMPSGDPYGSMGGLYGDAPYGDMSFGDMGGGMGGDAGGGGGGGGGE